jgi:hypothetical protein
MTKDHKSETYIECFTHGDHHFGIKVMEKSDYPALTDYCLQCECDGTPNNTSLEKMKVGRFNADRWWLVYDLDKNIIVSVAGAHPIDIYQQGCWRIMFRLATIKKYRAKAGPLYKDQRSCFGWGRLLPHQVKYCLMQGAKNVIFTTNSTTDGDSNSLKQNRICEAVFEKLGMAKKIDEVTLYQTKQNVWQVLITNVYTKEKLVLI